MNKHSLESKTTGASAKEKRYTNPGLYIGMDAENYNGIKGPEKEKKR